MSFTTADIAKLLDGEVHGDGTAILTGLAPAETAKKGDLTFAESPEYFATAEKSAATAIIAAQQLTSQKKAVIRVANPRVAFAKVVALFFPEPKFAPGIHPTAVVAASAKIDPTVHIGPHCAVGERVKLGAHCVLQGGDFIGDDVTVGEGTNLFPRVTIYPRAQIGKRVRIHAGAVIGADGFGYVFDAGAHRKIPQIGIVIIGDDVEIGANSAVDRGALGDTIIGQGAKIDNLVQVGHNVEVGDHTILCGQAGIAGSSKLGKYCMIAGQAGIAGHLKIGDSVKVGAQAGVMRNIPNGETWWGYPAHPEKEAKRVIAAARRLPELLKEIAAWKKKLGE